MRSLLLNACLGPSWVPFLLSAVWVLSSQLAQPAVPVPPSQSPSPLTPLFESLAASRPLFPLGGISSFIPPSQFLWGPLTHPTVRSLSSSRLVIPLPRPVLGSPTHPVFSVPSLSCFAHPSLGPLAHSSSLWESTLHPAVPLGVPSPLPVPVPPGPPVHWQNR